MLTVDRIPPQSFLDALIALKELTFCELPLSPLDLPRSLQRVMYHAKGQQRHYHPVNADSRPIERQAGEGEKYRSTDETRFLVKALKELPHLSSFSATCQTPETALASLNKFCREAGVEFFVCDSTAVYSVSLSVWTYILYKIFDLFYKALAQSGMTECALLLSWWDSAADTPLAYPYRFDRTCFFLVQIIIQLIFSRKRSKERSS